MMLTPEKTSEFVARINALVKELELDREDACTLMMSTAAMAMEEFLGGERAAAEVYLLSLDLARRAGIQPAPPPAQRH